MCSRAPYEICEWTSVEEDIRKANGPKLFMNFGLCAKEALRCAFGRPSEFRWDKELDSSLLRSFGNSRLHVKGRVRDRGDDNVHSCQSFLDRFFVRIVDLNQLGSRVNSGFRSLRWLINACVSWTQMQGLPGG